MAFDALRPGLKALHILPRALNFDRFDATDGARMLKNNEIELFRAWLAESKSDIFNEPLQIEIEVLPHLLLSRLSMDEIKKLIPNLLLAPSSLIEIQVGNLGNEKERWLSDTFPGLRKRRLIATAHTIDIKTSTSNIEVLEIVNLVENIRPALAWAARHPNLKTLYFTLGSVNFENLAEAFYAAEAFPNLQELGGGHSVPFMEKINPVLVTTSRLGNGTIKGASC